MNQVKCPSCARALAIPPEMAGKQVKCPLCSTVFAIPAAVAPAPELVPVVSAAPPPEEAFAFGSVGSTGEQLLNISETAGSTEELEKRRQGRLVESARKWLSTGGVLLVVLIVLYILVSGTQLLVAVYFVVRAGGPVEGWFGIALATFVLLIAVVLGSAVSWLMFAGASGLRRRRHFGLVITAIVFCFLVGVPSLLLSPVVLLGVFGLIRANANLEAMLALGYAALLFATGITLLGAAIKTIMAVGTPGISRAFQ